MASADAPRKVTFDRPEDSSDDEFIQESILDRLTGVIEEYVPEHLRNSVASKAEFASAVSKKLFNWGGSAAWIITTSMLVLVVPLFLAIETEQQLDQMEQEQQKQLQQQRQMLNPGLYAPPPGTPGAK